MAKPLASIFHVNGDDPEAVVHCAKIATEYRQKFNRDVVIDMVCYRRFGHNEGMSHPSHNRLCIKKLNHILRHSIYGERLSKEGLTSEQELQKEKVNFKNFWKKSLSHLKAISQNQVV